MFGYFIHGLESYVIKKYGKDIWIRIRMGACIFEETFDERMVYDDHTIFEIIDSACEVLELEEEKLHEEFGESYFSYCLNSNHNKLLKVLGGNLFDFLSNIDSLHDHIKSAYPGANMPSFRVTSDPSRTFITVNYYSHRDDFEYITKGIIKAAALELFKLNVNIETIYEKDSVMFIISARDCDDSWRMFPKQVESSRDLIPQADIPKISPLDFAKAFPFHILFDRDMVILQAGTTLLRILKETGLKMTSFFHLSQPQITFDFDSIHSRLNNAFVLTTQSERCKRLCLKGQMVYLEEQEQMLYLCSPSVNSLKDMRMKGLCLSDIPIHDTTRDLMLLTENFQKEKEITQQLGVVGDHLAKIHTELEEEMYLYNRLLYSVLPPSIARDLQESRPVSTERFSFVTLMFSGIVDFSELCEQLECMKIVNMLNALYVKFDAVVDQVTSYVYKVETVGDKYMTASGVPQRCTNHAEVICRLAVDMINASKHVLVQQKPIQVTIGIHSGEVVAGVIGQRTPRYCLFGNAVNLTSRTESTGLHGHINLTQDTYNLLEETGALKKFAIRKRGEVKMKGKSQPMTTYILSRTTSSKPTVPLKDRSPNLLTTAEGGVTLNRGSIANRTTLAYRFEALGISRSDSTLSTCVRSRSNSDNHVTSAK